MRPNQLLSIAFFLISGSLFSQNHLKVDHNLNAPTGDHVYSDLQECIDAANNGDIIHIIPSSSDYGNVIVDKELHFVGAGYVSDNQSGLTSIIETMSLKPPFANGTTIDALVFIHNGGSPLTFGVANGIADTLSNIEISNCKVPGMNQLANCYIKNMTIRNNIITNLSWIGPSTLDFQIGEDLTQNLLIANNIIGINTLYGTYNYPAINVANETVITNNLFFALNGFQAFRNLRNSTVINNVFYGASAANVAGGSSYGNVFSNNLSSECSTGGCDIPPASTDVPNNTGSGNLSNTDPYFEYLVDGWYWSVTYDLALLDLSPLADAGSDGTDIGISGGPYPFTNYKHLRNLPYIHQMNVTGLILENQDIQVNAEARTNQ